MFNEKGQGAMEVALVIGAVLLISASIIVLTSEANNAFLGTNYVKLATLSELSKENGEYYIQNVGLNDSTKEFKVDIQGEYNSDLCVRLVDIETKVEGKMLPQSAIVFEFFDEAGMSLGSC